MNAHLEVVLLATAVRGQERVNLHATNHPMNPVTLPETLSTCAGLSRNRYCLRGVPVDNENSRSRREKEGGGIGF
eukprot:scaffold145142_cov31-Tisochrysis_lutea.AAC.2